MKMKTTILKFVKKIIMKEDNPRYKMRSLISHATQIYHQHVINVKIDDKGLFHLNNTILLSRII